MMKNRHYLIVIVVEIKNSCHRNIKISNTYFKRDLYKYITIMSREEPQGYYNNYQKGFKPKLF